MTKNKGLEHKKWSATYSMDKESMEIMEDTQKNILYGASASATLRWIIKRYDFTKSMEKALATQAMYAATYRRQIESLGAEPVKIIGNVKDNSEEKS